MGICITLSKSENDLVKGFIQSFLIKSWLEGWSEKEKEAVT